MEYKFDWLDPSWSVLCQQRKSSSYSFLAEIITMMCREKYIYLKKYQLCVRSNYFYIGFGERPASVMLMPYFLLNLTKLPKEA